MLVNTHVLIARRVLKNLEHEQASKLNTMSFIYGNVKPDLSSLISFRPHRMKDSLDYVIQEVTKLLYPKTNDINHFSISLGEVSHYFSDFFCSPHYDRSKFRGLYHHLSYECKLHLLFSKMQDCHSLKIPQLNLDMLLEKDLKKSLLLLETEYKKVSLNLENDIFFAVRASTLATQYILNNSLFDFSKVSVA